MAVLRPHLALTVTDVERSIPFYEALFGVGPEKRKAGYAKFSVAERLGDPGHPFGVAALDVRVDDRLAAGFAGRSLLLGSELQIDRHRYISIY